MPSNQERVPVDLLLGSSLASGVLGGSFLSCGLLSGLFGSFLSRGLLDGLLGGGTLGGLGGLLRTATGDGESNERNGESRLTNDHCKNPSLVESPWIGVPDSSGQTNQR